MWHLLAGILVFLMQPGFAMLEAGSVGNYCFLSKKKFRFPPPSPLPSFLAQHNRNPSSSPLPKAPKTPWISSSRTCVMPAFPLSDFGLLAMELPMDHRRTDSLEANMVTLFPMTPFTLAGAVLMMKPQERWISIHSFSSGLSLPPPLPSYLDLLLSVANWTPTSSTRSSFPCSSTLW